MSRIRTLHAMTMTDNIVKEDPLPESSPVSQILLIVILSLIIAFTDVFCLLNNFV